MPWTRWDSYVDGVQLNHLVFQPAFAPVRVMCPRCRGCRLVAHPFGSLLSRHAKRWEATSARPNMGSFVDASTVRDSGPTFTWRCRRAPTGAHKGACDLGNQSRMVLDACRIREEKLQESNIVRLHRPKPLVALDSPVQSGGRCTTGTVSGPRTARKLSVSCDYRPWLTQGRFFARLHSPSTLPHPTTQPRTIKHPRSCW